MGGRLSDPGALIFFKQKYECNKMGLNPQPHGGLQAFPLGYCFGFVISLSYYYFYIIL
jgi:hypothetical protein